MSEEIRPLTTDELNSPAYAQMAQAIFGENALTVHLPYCRWLFAENPANPWETMLPVYVCWDGDQAVGQVGIIPVEVILGGEHQTAGWTVDFHILPSHQRRGIGGKLLAAAHEQFPVLMTLGQTEASRRLFLKCGWHDAGTMSTYRSFLRPSRCIPKKVLHKLGILGRGSVNGHRTSPCPQLQTQLDTRFVDARNDLPAAPDATRRASNDEFIICRSQRFLRWRYLTDPHFKYEILSIRISRYAEGFAVWRVSTMAGMRSAALVDLIYPHDLSPADLCMLLETVLQGMMATGIERMACETSDPWVLNALPKRFFSKCDSGARLLYGRADGQRCPPSEAQQWRLYGADCDIDMLEGRRAGS